MRAFIIDRYQGPLHEADVPEPVLGEGDVLIDIKAASVNQLDEKIRKGEFKQILPYKLPFDPRQRRRRDRDRRRGEGPRLLIRRRGVRPARQGPDRHLRRAHRRRRGRSGTEARVDQHGGGRLAAAGRPDRVAGPRRARQRAARAEGPHPRRGRRGRFDRHPARQAPRRAPSPPPRQRGNADFVRDARRRHRHRLPHPGLSNSSCTATTSCSTASAGRTSRSPCGSCGPAARRSASPARPTPRSPRPPASTRRCGWPSPPSARRSAARPRSSASATSSSSCAASGDQLAEITALVDAGALRPVVGKVFPFEQTPDAVAALAKGGIRGKAVVARG